MKLQPQLLMIVLFVSATLSVPAQEKRLAPGDPKREVHIFDIRDLVTLKDPGDQITAVDKQKIEAINIKALVGFITTFIQPCLQCGLRGLGQRDRLTLLSTLPEDSDGAAVEIDIGDVERHDFFSSKREIIEAP